MSTRFQPFSFSLSLALAPRCARSAPSDQVDKGLELLREMVDAGVPRDCFSYNAALVG